MRLTYRNSNSLLTYIYIYNYNLPEGRQLIILPLSLNQLLLSFHKSV